MATSIKISQLPAKSSNLEATDLLEVSEFNGTGYVSKSITGQEIIDSVPSSVTAWGTITGTLSAQTDLNTALSGKQATVTLTTTGTSGASTFVANTLNVPTYSLSGLGGVPTTRTLTINGTTQDLSADRTFTVSTGITIGTTAITSGTVGRVLFQGTGNVVSQSADFFWDNTNGRLGIGTSTPTEKFEIVSGAIQLSNAQPIRSRYTGGTAFTILQMFSDNNTYLDGGNDILFRVNAGATTAMRLKNTGNVLINTTTDAGFKLDVNGTARVINSISVNTGNVNGQGVQIGNDTNSGIFLVSGATQFRQYSSAFEFAGLGTNVFLRTDSTRLQTKANYGISLGTYAASTPEASAILQAVSTTQGFLPPRMTTTQKNAIASPTAGLVVYDSTLNKLCVRTASAWETITSL